LLLYSIFFTLCLNYDALEAANARIFSLEAKLEASRKAWDAATAAKTNAEKATKSALPKAKKAEKALSNTNKGYLQREQAVTEWLNKMSALAGGEYHAFPSFLSSCPLLCLLTCDFPSVFIFLVA
jgi:hypothetical protein